MLLQFVDWTGLLDPASWERELVLAFIIVAYLVYRIIDALIDGKSMLYKSQSEHRDEHLGDLRAQVSATEKRNKNLRDLLSAYRERILDFDKRLQDIADALDDQQSSDDDT